mgnify:CR=1 FL=1
MVKNEMVHRHVASPLGAFQRRLLLTAYFVWKTGRGVFMDDLLYKRGVMRREGSTLESDRKEVRCFYNAMRRLVRRRFIAIPHRTRQGRYPLIMLTDYGERTAEKMVINLKRGFGKQNAIEYIKDMFDLIDALADAYDTHFRAHMDPFEIVNVSSRVTQSPARYLGVTKVSLSDFRVFLKKISLYRFSSAEDFDAHWTPRKLLKALRRLTISPISSRKPIITVTAATIFRLKEITIKELVGGYQLYLPQQPQ